ncbi:hypothetical protein [Bacillus taeanensis]|uniref:Uncharacterized protein n=1 Tax=Bacillus taeanensis TaxID=273032 RepID=A0A366Y4H0_9BACI|nr:hypothetical protein [Bacillus taeanensis]RBW71313.1 hypothetical protein DS031_00750 [Bacillus taeanensis]
MNNYINGQILSGKIDYNKEEFIVDQIKMISTASVINEFQLHKIYNQLSHLENEESFVLTVNDQFPLKLNAEEIDLLKSEIEHIQSLLG